MFVGIASLLMWSLLEPFIKDNSYNLLPTYHAFLSLKHTEKRLSFHLSVPNSLYVSTVGRVLNA